MSDQNVAIVRRAGELLARSYRNGEVVPEMVALCSPEIRIDASRRVFNPDRYEGHEGLRRLIREVSEAWADFTEVNRRLVDAGDRVVVLQTISGRGRASGVDVQTDGALVWELRDGLVVGVDVFLDQDEALAFAGER